MMQRCLLSLFVFSAAAVAAAAAPPVTSADAPSPGPAVARLWEKAEREIESAGPDGPRSETARMLLAVRRDEKLAPGVGWYDQSRRRYDWKWLAASFDTDRDGAI